MATHAQNSDRTPSASAPHRIGLVDIGYIFDNYKKLEVRRNALQAEIKAAAQDPELASIKGQIETLKGQLEKVTDGSQKAIEIEQSLIELNAKGQAESASLKREFMRKEAAMYRGVYDEITNMVKLYAEGQNYTLVLRYHRDRPEGMSGGVDPEGLRARLNRLVVYHQSGDDMTDRILKYMNEQYAKAGGQTAAQPATNATQ